MDHSQLTQIAIDAAQAAGKIIQKYMHDDIRVEHKQAGASYASQVVTSVDRECEAVILSQLLPSCKEYDLALLSEETEDDGSRFEKDFFWCIDPMDGTLPFINKYPGFSVSIALVARDGTPHIGVVYDPSTNTIYHGIKDKGVYKNGSPWISTRTNKHFTYVTDKRLEDTNKAATIEKLINQYAQKHGLGEVKEIVGAGAVLNANLVLENGPACMIKLPKKEMGGGSLWDYAATACIFQEMNLPATNFEERTLDLNRKDGTFMNHEGVLYLNVSAK